MKQKSSVLVLCALTAAFAGCAEKVEIGAATSPVAFKDDRENLPMVPNGPETAFVVVKARDMKAGASYVFNNVNVAVFGDIPDGVSIRGVNGQLKIGGNIGKDVTIDVQVPNRLCAAAGLRGPVVEPCGALPPFDQAPAIDIFGDVPESTRVTSTGTIVSKPIW